MTITASTPDAFFDCEPWAFDLSIRQPDGSAPLDLTGSRLFIRFCAAFGGTVVGTCDTSDGSTLVIADAVNGRASFLLPVEGRTWRVSRSPGTGAFAAPAQVVGDLYRLAPGATDWKGISRVQIPVLPSTGLPVSS